MRFRERKTGTSRDRLSEREKGKNREKNENRRINNKGGEERK